MGFAISSADLDSDHNVRNEKLVQELSKTPSVEGGDTESKPQVPARKGSKNQETSETGSQTKTPSVEGGDANG